MLVFVFLAGQYLIHCVHFDAISMQVSVYMTGQYLVLYTYL